MGRKPKQTQGATAAPAPKPAKPKSPAPILPPLSLIEQELAARYRAARRAKGLADPLWFCSYYFPERFTAPFGPHHRIIADDFAEMVRDRDLSALSAQHGTPWQEVRVMVDRDGVPAEELPDDADRAPDETEDAAAARLPDTYYSEAEWQALADAKAETATVRTAADACPRESGKTSLYDSLRLWAICYELTRFMLLGADTIGQGKAYLATLKGDLESNERLREDFGDLVGRRKWTETDVVTSSGVRVMVFGTRTKLRGTKHGNYRPDLAILDDGENDEFVDTEAQRAKTRNWLTKVLIPCIDSETGVLIVVGTILHHDSMLARLLSKDHFPAWRKRLFKSLEHVERAIAGTVKRVLQALWPSRWPADKLLAKRLEIGPVAFAAEYQNEPMADEASWFPLAQLNAAKERGRGRRFAESWEDVRAAFGGRRPLAVLQGWDFGWVNDAEKADATDSNYTFGISLGIDPETRHLKVLRLWRHRGVTPAKTRAVMLDEAAAVRPTDGGPTTFAIGVESVGLQKELYFHDVRSSSDLPLHPLQTTARKRHLRDGVPGLSAWFEGGTIDFPWPEGDDAEAREQRELVQVLCNELWGHGKEGHDDGVMALWFLLRMVRAFLARYDVRAKRGEAPAPESYYRDGPGDDDLDGKKARLQALQKRLEALQQMQQKRGAA